MGAAGTRLELGGGGGSGGGGDGSGGSGCDESRVDKSVGEGIVRETVPSLTSDMG